MNPYNDLNDDAIKVSIPKFKSIEYNISTIVEKISNIDSLDEDEIKNIILRQHNMILNYDIFLSSEQSRGYAQRLFSNKRFLEIFNQIIGLIQLTDHEKTCINKLAYDYYIIPEKDPSVSELLLCITYQINNIDVIRLSPVLGVQYSRILAMISHSAFKDDKKVHRINTFLVRSKIQYDAQSIIQIYTVLFERFRELFTNSMLEAKPNNLNELQNHNFDTITISLLAMLDSMPMDEIKKVLYNYAFTLKLIKTDLVVRFSIKKLKGYPRIVQVANDVENDVFDDLRIP